MQTSGPGCKICSHDQRDDIERDMIVGKADTAIAKAYGAVASTIGRHRRNCIPEALARSRHVEKAKRGDWITEECRHLYAKARDVIEKAEAEETAEIKRILRGMKAADREKITLVAEAMAGNRADVLAAIRTAKPVLELLAKLQGQLQEQVTINLATSPDYAELRNTLLKAIEPHKEVWLDISDALNEFEARRNADAQPMH